jgi:hypothetical protein
MIKSEKMRCAIKILKYKATKNIYFKKRYEQYINDISVWYDAAIVMRDIM